MWRTSKLPSWGNAWGHYTSHISWSHWRSWRHLCCYVYLTSLCICSIMNINWLGPWWSETPNHIKIWLRCLSHALEASDVVLSYSRSSKLLLTIIEPLCITYGSHLRRRLKNLWAILDIAYRKVGSIAFYRFLFLKPDSLAHGGIWSFDELSVSGCLRLIISCSRCKYLLGKNGYSSRSSSNQCQRNVALLSFWSIFV